MVNKIDWHFALLMFFLSSQSASSDFLSISLSFNICDFLRLNNSVIFDAMNG